MSPRSSPRSWACTGETEAGTVGNRHNRTATLTQICSPAEDSAPVWIGVRRSHGGWSAFAGRTAVSGQLLGRKASCEWQGFGSSIPLGAKSGPVLVFINKVLSKLTIVFHLHVSYDCLYTAVLRPPPPIRVPGFSDQRSATAQKYQTETSSKRRLLGFALCPLLSQETKAGASPRCIFPLPRISRPRGTEPPATRVTRWTVPGSRCFCARRPCLP